MSTLRQLLALTDTTPEKIAEHLDKCTSQDRLAEVRRLSAKEQARLYDLVAGAVPINLDHFVPPSTPPMKEVIHHGKNSLPMFTEFQKRFCRPEDSSADLLYGYNEQRLRPITGPGYFVVRPLETEKRVVLDYTQVPPVHPSGWPRIYSNSRLASRLVFHQMQDFMWKVSEHVSIGRAFKSGKWMPNWFVLCRED